MATHTKEFRSLNEFYTYLCNTPINDAFRWANLESTGSDRCGFYQTKSFNEAVDLMRNGWSQMATNLNTKLNLRVKQTQTTTKRKQQLGVAGFQPIVPLYLAGVPTNMLSQVQVKLKSKVVNVVKPFNYNCKVKAETIVEESVKTLQIVKQLEAQGYRVNLSVAFGTANGAAKFGTELCVKVLIKSANEKLNVSKLAFPLVHPSMLRRLIFRYIEVCPHTTKDFVHGYGVPLCRERMQAIYSNEIVLPSIYEGDVKNVRSLEDLVATV